MTITLPTEKSEPTHSLGRYTSLLYGMPKVGKTTFASRYPKTLFLLTTPAPEALSLYKIQISSWNDFLEAGRGLVNQDHNFQTVVVDTAPGLYDYCREYVRNRDEFDYEGDLPMGKGWEIVRSEFYPKVAKLCSLGMGVIFIAHAQQRVIKDMSGRERTKIVPQMDKNCGKVIRGLSSFILYAEVDEEGHHVLRTRPTVRFEAGVRTPEGTLMKDPLPLDYEIFEREFKQTFEGNGE